MSPHGAVSHRRVARHTLWNIFGYIAPLVVAFFALPPTVARLGIERYGLLALILVVHDYFNYFDFGLGRATTRFMASAVHDPARKDSAGAVLWTCLLFHVGLGILVGLLFYLGLPLVTERLLVGSPALVIEGRATLRVAALLAPVLLFMIAVRGALEAAQRFDLVNAVKVPSNTLTFLLPLVGAAAGLALPAIIGLFVVARLAAGLVYLALCLREFPSARTPRLDLSLTRPLFSFGGLVMATNLAGLLLIDGERFLISALASVEALTYYSVPNDASTRLWIIPASVASALFPIFTIAASGADTRSGRLYADSTLYLVILFVPLVVVLEAFAGPLMGLWMGAAFAERATLVLQISTIGVFLDSLARIPLTYLQATGRPGIPARIRIYQLPVYLLMSAFCITRWGITGAAWVWSGRIALETAVLFAVTSRGGYVTLPADALARLNRGLLVSVLVLLCGAAVTWMVPAGVLVRMALTGLLLLVYAWYAWLALVDPGHREKIGLLMARATPS
ncbi:MAG: flippase [Gemmatimonadota bacterium]|nr:flippase [Gemmatimonadota bacterium]